MASITFLFQPWFSSCINNFSLKKHKFLQHHHYCVAKASASSSSSSGNLGCKNKRSSSVSHRSNSQVPLLELPGASLFDQYMEDKGRVIRSIFPERSTSRQLNEELWRVNLSPIQVLFLTCHPVIEISARYISNGEDYPHEIPRHVTKLLEVNIKRWELEGLDSEYMPCDVNINAKGTLYLENKGTHSFVKTQLHINLALVFPPLLAWVPQHLLHNILQSIIRNYVEDINKGFAVRLLADYNSFKRSTQRSTIMQFN